VALVDEAQAIKGGPFVVYVDMGQDLTPHDQRTLSENIRFAQNLGGTVVRQKGNSVAEEVAKVVPENRITQVIFGRSAQTGWKKHLYLTEIQQFLRDAPPVDVHNVTQEVR
jgi:two-component system sensor histidine kinase KdpD